MLKEREAPNVSRKACEFRDLTEQGDREKHQLPASKQEQMHQLPTKPRERSDLKPMLLIVKVWQELKDLSAKEKKQGSVSTKNVEHIYDDDELNSL